MIILWGQKADSEDYTYGERLTNAQKRDGSFLNQIEEAIKRYKKEGFGTNQIILQVGQPSDLLLDDPPCLRHVDTKIRDNTLHFFPYFRSWDLWGGFPANLAALQLLKEYMA
jgi:thymidylate synthase